MPESTDKCRCEGVSERKFQHSGPEGLIMVFLTSETSSFLALWFFLYKQEHNLLLNYRQPHGKSDLSLCSAIFWTLESYGNLKTLYQSSTTCNLEAHAQNAGLNLVDLSTVITPLLS